MVFRRISRQRCQHSAGVSLLARLKNLGLALGTVLLAFAAQAQTGGPTRAPEKGCTWERLVDARLGVAAWAQRCVFSHRKVHLAFKGKSLVIQFSDGGAASPVVDVLDLLALESPRDGILRWFTGHTEKTVAKKCVLTDYAVGLTPAGVQRFTFVPGVAYRKQLAAQAHSDDIPEPACGDWGEMPDGIQYFETAAAGRSGKFLFVRAGQETPLFDENSLQLLVPQ